MITHFSAAPFGSGISNGKALTTDFLPVSEAHCVYGHRRSRSTSQGSSSPKTASAYAATVQRR